MGGRKRERTYCNPIHILGPLLKGRNAVSINFRWAEEAVEEEEEGSQRLGLKVRGEG